MTDLWTTLGDFSTFKPKIWKAVFLKLKIDFKVETKYDVQ